MDNMKKEDSDLLFRDLCLRLPYGVKCLVNYTICNETTDYNDVPSSTVDTITTINRQTESYFFEWLSEWFDCDEFKPYLFPLSSMTEEQEKELFDIWLLDGKNISNTESLKNKLFEVFHDAKQRHNMGLLDLNTSMNNLILVLDWFNKNHFDYRGLIPMGLAKDATGLNIY